MQQATIFIIIGGQGAGKTSLVKEVLEICREKKMNCEGFLAEGEWEGGMRSQFTLLDVNTGKKALLCQAEFSPDFVRNGRFYFNPEAIHLGENIIENAIKSKAEIVVMDEIGMFELRGEVWAKTLKHLLENHNKCILLTVRDKFLEAVIDKFQMSRAEIFELNCKASSIAGKMIKQSSK